MSVGRAPRYQGVFGGDGWCLDVGVDPAGLFVLDTSVQGPREMFRSTRCSQEVIGAPADGKGRLVRLTDAATSGSVTLALTHALFDYGTDPGPARYPRRLRVAAMPWAAREFDSIGRALEEVLRAAVETGNPVLWQ